MPETIELSYWFFLVLCIFAGIGLGGITGTIHRRIRDNRCSKPDKKPGERIHWWSPV